jgi:hypothetical protein
MLGKSNHLLFKSTPRCFFLLVLSVDRRIGYLFYLAASNLQFISQRHLMAGNIIIYIYICSHFLIWSGHVFTQFTLHNIKIPIIFFLPIQYLYIFFQFIRHECLVNQKNALSKNMKVHTVDMNSPICGFLKLVPKLFTQQVPTTTSR